MIDATLNEEQTRKQIAEIEEHVRDVSAHIKRLKKEKNQLTALIPELEAHLRAMQPPNPKGASTIGI